MQSTLTLNPARFGNSTPYYPDYSVDVLCRQEIIEKLHGQVVRLSQHKFASNVIEKCLQYGDSNSRQVSCLCLMQQQPLLCATTALASCSSSPCFAQQQPLLHVATALASCSNSPCFVQQQLLLHVEQPLLCATTDLASCSNSPCFAQ